MSSTPYPASSKRGTGSTARRASLKLKAVCSWPLGCNSRHSSSRSGSIADITALVLRIFAWQAGHSEIIKRIRDRPGLRWCMMIDRLSPAPTFRRPSRCSSPAREPVLGGRRSTADRIDEACSRSRNAHWPGSSPGRIGNTTLPSFLTAADLCQRGANRRSGRLRRDSLDCSRQNGYVSLPCGVHLVARQDHPNHQRPEGEQR